MLAVWDVNPVHVEPAADLELVASELEPRPYEEAVFVEEAGEICGDRHMEQ